MKMTTIAASALVVLLVAGIGTIAVANSGHQNGATEHGPRDPHDGHHPACSSLSVGETLKVTLPHGHYANATERTIRGNASGAFDLKVSQLYVSGCIISLTGGSFKLGSTSYTITGGSIVFNHGGRSGEGTGTTSTGTFLITIAGLHGNTASADVGAIRLDLKIGSSEFLVQLSSPESEE